MKHMKKLLSLVVALVMVMAMAMPAFAHSITITDADGSTEAHTYEAFQIFSGEYDATAQKLFNVDWGTGVAESGTFTFKEVTYDLAKKDDAAKLAEALSGTANEADDAKAFAQAIAAVLTGTKATVVSNENHQAIFTDLSDGYYFIKEAEDSLEAGTEDAYTRYILSVAGRDLTVTAKSSVPTVTKKVQDINDSEDTEAGDMQDSADYDIGDHVPFTLTGTMPGNIDEYKTYKYVFHDTLSTGLKYDDNAVVMIGDQDVTDAFTIEHTDGKLTIGCDDLKAIAGVTITPDTKVVVTYTATLDASAVTGGAGNDNKVNLEFSNDPNGDGDGSTGTTPDDTVVVFTFKVVINKVNENQRPLEGAAFTLQKKNADGVYEDIEGMVNVPALKTEDGSYTLNFTGIDDGDYKLIESTTPDGYNTMEDQYFSVIAEHDADSDDPKLTSLTVKYFDKEGNEITDPADQVLNFTTDTGDGSLTTDVVNRFGSLLPSTGGIGTTIFYVVGGLLAVGAGVLLITKKRMSREV